MTETAQDCLVILYNVCLFFFRREIDILDLKKWNDLRDDLNDDASLSVA